MVTKSPVIHDFAVYLREATMTVTLQQCLFSCDGRAMERQVYRHTQQELETCPSNDI